MRPATTPSATSAAPASSAALAPLTPLVPLAPLDAAPAAPAAAVLAEPVLAARAWLSLDLNSGAILSEAQPDQQLAPASLTKLMTAYVVFDALAHQRLSAAQPVAVSNHAWRTGGSRMFLQTGHAVTVDELLQGLLVQSGNDAATALAEAVGGSESGFVALMNEQAQRLGMSRSRFMNPTGLPDAAHLTTVRDLSRLASRLIGDFPQYFHYFSQKSFTYGNITQPNRNRLLFSDASVDGMKTGYTDAAGYCQVSTALRDGRRVLTVVAGTGSVNARTTESARLLDWSYQAYETVRLFGPGQAPLRQTVWEGQADQAVLAPAKPVWVTVPRGRTADIRWAPQTPADLIAPLAQGQSVGTLQFTLDGRPLASVPLVVREAVAQAGWLGRMADQARRWYAARS